MSEKKEFTNSRDKVTFMDLFAGAGGISEGFLQAYTDDKYYDFVLASDINENCELTHRVRYNHQLGLDTQFIRQDIMEDSFLDNLIKLAGDKKIDVITGGPSCQSFSLSGRRRKFDKRDDLFKHYLKVIEHFKPKYFVMENVKGLLTKDSGRIKDRILKEIRSIIDTSKLPELYSFIENIVRVVPPFTYSILKAKLDYEVANYKKKEAARQSYVNLLSDKFKDITRLLNYKVSKTDASVNTVRHGLHLLEENTRRETIRKEIIQLKTRTDLDNDAFVDSYNKFIDEISDGNILTRIFSSLNLLDVPDEAMEHVEELKRALEIYVMTMDEFLDAIQKIASQIELGNEFSALLRDIRLYNIQEPMVLLASNYGVPQNRERVVFIGCRNDQRLITSIPATVKPNEKVTVFEALWDLDMIGNGEEVSHYLEVKPNTKYEALLQHRAEDGKPNSKGKLYNEWLKRGHLMHRFANVTPPYYTRDMDGLDNPLARQEKELYNHQTSLQKAEVLKRLAIIMKCGDYTPETKKVLKAQGLDSDKRNYNVLAANGQSPTVMTIPDDYIHYSAHRPLTVREMARLQSFDDSFVFQGKRSTGGEKRKVEIPQCTLVGNAVPPLMARAIGNVILKNIQ